MKKLHKNPPKTMVKIGSGKSAPNSVIYLSSSRNSFRQAVQRKGC